MFDPLPTLPPFKKFRALRDLLQEHRDRINAITPAQGFRTRLRYTYAGGVAIDGNPAVEEVEEQSTPFKRFYVFLIAGDYLQGVPYNEDRTVPYLEDGVTIDTSNLTYIAKPYALRVTPFHTATRNGRSYQYDLNGDETGQTRTVNFNDLFAQQGGQLFAIETMSLDYAVGDYIWAYEPFGGTGARIDIEDPSTELTWLDANHDARHWEIKPRRYDICVAGNNKKVAIQGGEPR